MSSKRPRTWGGTSTSATKEQKASTLSIHPLNQFSTQHHQDKYEVLSKLPIKPNRYYELLDLMTLGIGDEVKGLVNRIEWNQFLDIKESIVRKLLLELLCTFNFHKMNCIDYD